MKSVLLDLVRQMKTLVNTWKNGQCRRCGQCCSFLSFTRLQRLLDIECISSIGHLILLHHIKYMHTQTLTHIWMCILYIIISNIWLANTYFTTNLMLFLTCQTFQRKFDEKQKRFLDASQCCASDVPFLLLPSRLRLCDSSDSHTHRHTHCSKPSQTEEAKKFV